MKTLVAFAKTFGVNVVVMEGSDFKVEMRNGILTTNNEPALRSALEKDLNSSNPTDRMYASEMLDIIKENSLIH
jgi:hypothetical protein